MKAYAVVGRPGAGKTTFTRQAVQHIAHRLPPLVYDTNNEWNTGAPLPELDAFLDHVIKNPGRVVVIEDATLFFHVAGHSDKLKRILIGKRHTRTTAFLLFHSLRQVPLYILDALDGIAVFRTNDNPDKVAARYEAFPAVVEAHAKVNADAAAGVPYPFAFASLR